MCRSVNCKDNFCSVRCSAQYIVISINDSVLSSNRKEVFIRTRVRVYRHINAHAHKYLIYYYYSFIWGCVCVCVCHTDGRLRRYSKQQNVHNGCCKIHNSQCQVCYNSRFFRF